MHTLNWILTSKNPIITPQSQFYNVNLLLGRFWAKIFMAKAEMKGEKGAYLDQASL